MNLILLSPEDFTGPKTVRLEGRRCRHISGVHRAAAGRTLCVGLKNGRIGSGTVTSIKELFVEMEVSLDRDPPEPQRITLILGLPRPKVLRRVLFSAAVMGIKKIYFLNSFRVEKSFWLSPLVSDESIRMQLELGLEQARDTVMPEVFLRPLFKPFVEDELPGLTRDTLAFAAHPYAESCFPHGLAGPSAVAIGPEGGFIDYEINKLAEAGFKPVNLGKRVMNIEAAVPYCVSRLTP
ncbi:MAG: 16S rRNA (uracil(1498)-N(3))-methyltransferase [Nitrospirae bacterium]|nr:MAG: 16S rRNA (uracil(1498)-N(3))-methyltransferase [Nitrospirota bacterium]